MVQFTVAICTYNGETRLPQVLECLRSQSNSQHLSWEVIIVDNNSSDRTPEIVGQYQETWLNNSSLRYCFESRQGLAFARQRAIEEASAPLVGFLDDDNLPEEDWLEEAYTFAQGHPKVGAYGSQIYGDFEVNPPPDFQKIACFLAITQRGSQAYIYEPRQRVLPPAAGLVVRRQVWLDNVPRQLFLTGRVGQSMLASEDLEALCYIQGAGWEIWYNPNMKIAHKIPRHRLERDYLTALVRGIGLARHHIRMLRLSPWQRPLAAPVYLANDLRKVIVYFFKQRQNLPTDLIAACEMNFLLGSLLSPFYLWKKRWLN
jgi:glycosyltransferase involved in cell wall biosynthesis